MKLSINFAGIEKALKSIGGQKALIRNIRIKRTIESNPIELKLLEEKEIFLTGEEVLKNISFSGGLLAIKNTQVTLHIYHPYEDEESLTSLPARKTRFHISECSTLINMRTRGRFDRFVISTKTDGFFKAQPFDWETEMRGEEILARLSPCKNCLKNLDYKNYNDVRKENQNKIVKQFSVEEFFNEHKSIFRCLPLYSSATYPDGNYTSDWAEISHKFRSVMKWKCSCCKAGFSKNPGLLHAHHKDGIRGNNKHSNLRSLCALCHKNQPSHERMFINPNERLTIEKARIADGLKRKCTSCGS